MQKELTSSRTASTGWISGSSSVNVALNEKIGETGDKSLFGVRKFASVTTQMVVGFGSG
jgi:hypothetical protein